MSLINCPGCGKQISDKAELCPHCGINPKAEIITKKLETYEDTESKPENFEETGKKIVNANTENIQIEKKSNPKTKRKICMGVLGGICILSLIGNIVQFAEIHILSQKGNSIIVENQESSNMSSFGENIEEPGQSTTNNVVAPEDADVTIPFIPDNLFKNYRTSGTYKCGTDLDPGKYIIYGFLGNGSYKIYTELAKSEEAEYIYGIFMSVELKDGQYIDVANSSIIIPETEFDSNNLTQYGIYEVGKDIEPGEYRIIGISNEYESQYGSWIGDFGGIEISDAPISGNIIDYQSNIGTDQKYISVQKGQYLRGVDVALYKVNK